jgi:hypothetical protein
MLTVPSKGWCHALLLWHHRGSFGSWFEYVLIKMTTSPRHCFSCPSSMSHPSSHWSLTRPTSPSFATDPKWYCKLFDIHF